MIYSACFGSIYNKIGTMQRRLAWPLCKDDTQNLWSFSYFGGFDRKQHHSVKKLSFNLKNSLKHLWRFYIFQIRWALCSEFLFINPNYWKHCTPSQKVSVEWFYYSFIQTEFMSSFFMCLLLFWFYHLRLMDACSFLIMDQRQVWMCEQGKSFGKSSLIQWLCLILCCAL